MTDADSRELDFVVLKDRKPLFAVECKTGEKQKALISNTLKSTRKSQSSTKSTLENQTMAPHPPGELCPF